MRPIDADALIADMQERYCKPCKEKGEDYHEVRCRACWVDDAINDVDGFADNSIDIVFCKECKHYDTDMWAEKGTYWCGRISDWGNCKYVNADDFCSRGERREP